MNLDLANRLCAVADRQLPSATRGLAALDLALDRIRRAEATRPLVETLAGQRLLGLLPFLVEAIADGRRDYRELVEGRPWRWPVEAEAVRLLVGVEALVDQHEADALAEDP